MHMSVQICRRSVLHFLARCGRRTAPATRLALNAAAHTVYPESPIRLAVDPPPRRATNVATRVAAKKRQELLKQPVIIDNMRGATSIVGEKDIVELRGRGYMLLVRSSGPADGRSVGCERSD